MLLTANILQPLINVFGAVLVFFHNHLLLGWGLSIVLLTVVIRAFLVPLTVKQYRSMQKLQAHQPELKALQAKYKDDKQRLNQEVMKFYKENNVNPLGSCLPLLLQFPVFISLYYLLRSNLRGDICPQIQHAYQAVHGAGQTTACGVGHGAQFLFIPDLTDKATGAVLIVLMVLYVSTQLFSSLLMSSPAMDPTQRKIMMFMPLVFVIFFINFPAGVILYWITTNLWTMGQQVIVRKYMAPPPLAVAVAGAGAGGGGGPPGTASSARKPSGKPAANGAKSAKPAADGSKAARVGKPSGKPAANGAKSAKPAADGSKSAKPMGEPSGDGATPSADGGKSIGAGAKAAAAGLLRRRSEPAPEPSGTRSGRGGPPPPSPRKKKKRSGRRR